MPQATPNPRPLGAQDRRSVWTSSHTSHCRTGRDRYPPLPCRSIPGILRARLQPSGPAMSLPPELDGFSHRSALVVTGLSGWGRFYQSKRIRKRETHKPRSFWGPAPSVRKSPGERRMGGPVEPTASFATRPPRTRRDRRPLQGLRSVPSACTCSPRWAGELSRRFLCLSTLSA